MQSVSQKSSNDVQVQKKASIELDLLRSFGEKVYEEQRRVMLSPDMQFKLNTHMPTVLAVTESVYPNDETKQVAAFLHDIGRGDEFALTGGFVGKGELDHHEVGAKMLEDFWLSKNQDIDSPVFQAVYHAVRFHGLVDLKDKQGQEIVIPQFEALSDEQKDVVRSVSIADNITNGGQAAEYLHRELLEQRKNVFAGGFIPDETANSKQPSEYCLKAFEEGVNFNRNLECKTYADYHLFAGFLAVRELKSDDINRVKAMISVLEQPSSEVTWLKRDTHEVDSHSISSPITESWVRVDDLSKYSKDEVKLGVISHKNGLEAYRAIFKTSMDDEQADRCADILVNIYQQAKERVAAFELGEQLSSTVLKLPPPCL